MSSIARFVIRHRWWVFAVWGIALIAGGISASRVQDQLTHNFSLPGQEGSQTQSALARSYGVGSEVGYLPVLTAPEGQTIAEHRDDITAVADKIRGQGLQVLDYGETGDPKFLTQDGRSTFLFVYDSPGSAVDGPDDKVENAIIAAAQEAGFTAKVTGLNQLAEGNTDTAEEPSVLRETLLGAAGALIVLLFVFASFLALIPLIVAAVAILTTFLVVLALTTIADVSFIVQFLVALIGMGVAIDYSLLVVTRWREERSRGVPNDQAVVTAVCTAGHAVLASGVTVAISLLALVLVNVPAVRSMGYGGMLIPLISTLVVLTMLPALLSMVGPRIDWPRIRKSGNGSRFWAGWGRGVVRYRWAAAVLGITGLALAIIPVFGLQIGQPSAESLASKGRAHDALITLQDGAVGTGVLTPMALLSQSRDEATALAATAERVPGVRMVVTAPPAKDGTTEVLVIPENETVDNTSIAVVSRVRDATKDLPGYVGVTGIGAGVIDWQRAVYRYFPFILALIGLITFVLLVRSFRSILLPLKAVLVNMLSVAGVFGITTFFWQDGNGSDALFGVHATGAMTFWLPVVMFAFLFGLSMDYEVFILSRMREEYDRTGSTAYAVEHGLGWTGRLVTSGALILFFAFAALASTPDTDIKVLATSLGVGILLDATVIRALLVPALVSLFGKYNWWLPGWIARLLRVAPSPLKNETVLPPGFTAHDEPGSAHAPDRGGEQPEPLQVP